MSFKVLVANLVALCMVSMVNAQSSPTQIRGFGEVRYFYDPSNSAGAFMFGPFDVFLANAIDKNTSYLLEFVLEGHVDIERMYVQHEVSPWLKVGVGRFHTALGYWNETFHHGSYLATTAERPHFYRFEDDGGLLPVHTIGLEIRGNGKGGSGNLGYQINIGNGRGKEMDPPQTNSDKDSKKSLSGVVYYENNGIRYGANGYLDTIPTDGTSAITDCGGKEAIYGAHLVWVTPYFEWLNEFMKMNHKYNNNPSATEVNINLFYTQFGYHFGDYMPYLRVENISPDKGDPYFRDSNNTILVANDTWYTTAGVRYELSSASAIKIEAEEKNEKNKEKEYSGQMNWSFAW